VENKFSKNSLNVVINMLDLETFRKEIDEIYTEKVQNMVG
jgi:hypothetical protein